MFQKLRKNGIYIAGLFSALLVFGGLAAVIWYSVSGVVNDITHDKKLQPGDTFIVSDDSWVRDNTVRYGGTNGDGDLLFYYGDDATTVIPDRKTTFRIADEKLMVQKFDTKTNIVTIKRLDYQ